MRHSETEFDVWVGGSSLASGTCASSFMSEENITYFIIPVTKYRPLPVWASGLDLIKYVALSLHYCQYQFELLHRWQDQFSLLNEGVCFNLTMRSSSLQRNTAPRPLQDTCKWETNYLGIQEQLSELYPKQGTSILWVLSYHPCEYESLLQWSSSFNSGKMCQLSWCLQPRLFCKWLIHCYSHCT